MTIQHLRSSTANKRPTPAAMSDGQLAVNTNTASPGLFFKDSAGALIKVGPVHVGTTAPNASPASGGETGNTVGEQWLDTTGGTYVFKVWDGSAWRSESGTFVDVNGDVMTGALGIIAGSAGSPGLYFSGDTNTGLYSPGADQVAISTGGSGKLFVDASGRIGQNASAPTGPYTPISFKIPGGTPVHLYADTAYWGLFDNGGTMGGYAPGNGFAGHATNNFLNFFTAAQERLRISSAGLVGVGTSAPDSILDVRSSTAAGRTNVSFLNPASPNTANRIRIRLAPSSGFVGIDSHPYIESYCEDAVNQFAGLAFGTYGSGGVLSERLRIDSSGRVGIGTANIPETLSVKGNTITGSTVEVAYGWQHSGGTGLQINGNNGTLRPTLTLWHLYGSDSNAGQIVFKGLSSGGNILNNASIYATQTGTTTGSGSGELVFATGNALSERARLTASGQLLVGTSSYSTPSGSGSAQYAPLVVQGYTGGSTGAGIVTIANGTAGASITNNTVIGVLSFAGNNASEFATVKAEADAACGANDYPGRLVFSTTADGASSPTERMRITSDGRLFYNCTGLAGAANAPNANGGRVFETGGNLKARGDSTGATLHQFYAGENLVGTITTTSTATAYNTSSDYRLKENVTAVTDGITRLQQLKPSRFNFIADPVKTVDGFIAHEVQDVVPEAITGEKDAMDDDGNPIYQGIDQSKLVPLLTAALQEAIGEIESLKARLTAAGI